MKNKFNLGDSVQINSITGVVKELAPFADHFEYFVVYPDGSGAWYHEDKLSAVRLEPKAKTPSPK